MDADKPRRAWYRGKRTWAALALWLLVAYPLSIGPAEYCVERGWLAGSAASYRAPAFRLLPRYGEPPPSVQMGTDWVQFFPEPNPWTRPFYQYVDWCGDLGRLHRWGDADAQVFGGVCVDPADDLVIPPKPPPSN
jgi:hypothetical protein